MPHFKVISLGRREHIIHANDLDDAGRIADIKYPNWTDIYIMNPSNKLFDRLYFAYEEAATI